MLLRVPCGELDERRGLADAGRADDGGNALPLEIRLVDDRHVFHQQCERDLRGLRIGRETRQAIDQQSGRVRRDAELAELKKHPCLHRLTPHPVIPGQGRQLLFEQFAQRLHLAAHRDEPRILRPDDARRIGCLVAGIGVGRRHRPLVDIRVGCPRVRRSRVVAGHRAQGLVHQCVVVVNGGNELDAAVLGPPVGNDHGVGTLLLADLREHLAHGGRHVAFNFHELLLVTGRPRPRHECAGFQELH